MTPFLFTLLGTVGFLAVTLWLSRRYVKPFFNRITICLVVLAVATMFVVNAGILYQKGEGGFKLGVDLVGGTILVYEVDPDKEMKGAFKDNPELLAASLKRRIDPADLYNVTIRPVGSTRVEIILPTGGRHQSQADDKLWQDLLQKVAEKWPPVGYKAEQGHSVEIIAYINEQYPEVPIATLEKFVADNYKVDAKSDAKVKEAAWTKLLETA